MQSLTGLNRTTGRNLSGYKHLQQSIEDILTTPVGSRVMRPEYGSHLPRMVDLPVNKGWISAVQAEIARAIGRWEPRLKLSRVTIHSVIDGKVSMTIAGEHKNETVLIEVTA